MIDRQTTKPGRPSEQGAALIIAIAIMTILLAVGLTFYAISRQQVVNTINQRNQVQADLLVDASLAIAQAELNRDFMKHPNATSLDAAPFSLFDGGWVVGKQWALRNGMPLQADRDGIDNDSDGVLDSLDPDERGVALVNMTDLPLVQFNPVNPADGTYSEPLYSGPLSRDWLYYPRFENANNYLYGAPQFSKGVLSIDYLDRNTLAPFTNFRNGDPFNPFVFDPTSNNRPPFVTPAYYGPSLTDGGVAHKYPLEWIHTWTDVDNDGDGLNDAIWIPLPQDKFFSGGEFQEDKGGYQYDDGIDNDLDAAPHLLLDGITTVLCDERPEAGEGAMELGTFVYWGGDDGLDNDGDGSVDEAGAYAAGGEQDYFLTAPITGIQVYLDFNADGVVPDMVPDSGGVLRPLVLKVLLGDVTVQTKSGPITLLAANNNNVDAIDNDYDMLINDYQVYAYVGPNTLNGAPFMIQGFKDTGVPDGAGGTIVTSIENASANNSNPSLFNVARSKSYEPINIVSVLGAPGTVFEISPATGTFYSDTGGPGSTYDYNSVLPPLVVLTHSGEPVCELAGRAAITIRDESSKVNTNVSGGHTQNPLGGGLIRALGDGNSPSEYDTRTLPGIGTGLAFNMFAQRMGTPADTSNLYSAPGPLFDSYVEDVQAPGYGRVDDNSNILLLALNGKDDDGDGLVDEGLYLPNPGDPSFAAYYSQLGVFEGTDDPSEFQRYRPLSNLLAESRDPFNLSGFADDADNDRDGALNETGELGDLQLQDTLQLQEAAGIGTGIYGQLRQSVTAYSTDRNVNFVNTLGGTRALNKLDYNFANPQQIAANLILSNGAQAITARQTYFPNDVTIPNEPIDVTRSFADGLRQGNVSIRSHFGNKLLANTVGEFPADPVLEILQAAVDIVDNRDSDHSRSVLTTERRNRVPQTAALGFANYDFWPERLGTRENISEDEIMPLGELENYSLNTLGLNHRLEIRDDWWTNFAVNPAGTGVSGVTGNREERQISYTASGNEAIKINELMVRPVRRIEAETLVAAPTASDPMLDALSPLNYDPSAGYAALPGFIVERTQSVIGSWTSFPVAPATGFIGPDAYLQTSIVGDVLQFRIQASEGLPSGRYYLTVNTRGTVTPTGPVQLEYAVKYGAIDILTDVPGVPFATVPAQHISDSIPGTPPGVAFLNGTPGEVGDYFLDGGSNLVDVEPTTGFATFTVTVPAVGDLYIAFRMAGGPGTLEIDSLDFSQEPDHEWVELANTSAETVDLSGWELEVGIPKSGDDVPEDPFKSQWRIPVGTQVAPHGMVLLAFSKYDHYQRDFTVTTSSLLDYPGNRISDNGMGLAVSAAGTGQPFDSGGSTSSTFSLTNRTITVPPIQDVSRLLAPGNVYRDRTGSVFDRPIEIFVDYIDRDGDGLSSIFDLTPALDTDAAALEGSVRSTTDGDGGDGNNDGLDDFSGIAMSRRPWDRIVQMECNQWTTESPLSAAPVRVTLAEVQDVDDVALMVLRGGILPNYPEHDGIDNDGDGGYVDATGNYIPGTLERDMVDNNLDGVIDERGIRYNPLSTPGDPRDGVDNDGDTIIDEQDEWYLSYNLSAGEGVDEGRIIGSNILFEWRAYGTGSFEQFTLPYVFFNNRATYEAQYGLAVSNPGSMITPVDGGAGFGFNVLNGSTAVVNNFVSRVGRWAEPTDLYLNPVPVAVSASFYTQPTAPYIGAEDDPADWKAYAERRWNPGDNVIVTLYQGKANLGMVADRVTYREYDVINRTIDDVVIPNYVNVDADGSGVIGDTPADIPVLNREYPTFWRPNSMALDFYRSLERKSPLYTGDRFGTENRWQATDGNYDDWSDSLSYFEAELEPTVLANLPVLAADTLVNPRGRFVNFRQERLFRHAMAGSPLRMNAAARKTLNPPDIERVILAQTAPATDPTQFFNAFDYFRTHEDGVYNAFTNATKSLSNQTWNNSRAQVADRFYQSPGDLMRVPHQTYLHDAVNTRGGADFLRDMTMLNIQLQRDVPEIDSPSSVQDIALRGATLGQDDYTSAVTGNVLTAAVNSMSTDSVVLTVGQAEFHPIRPDLMVVAQPDRAQYVNWVGDPGLSNNLFAPAAWAPVFLFDLDQAPGNWDSTLSDTERFPFYPSYVSGANITTMFERNYLFGENYFRANQGAAYLNAALPDHFQDRWPLERRTMMYVSQVRPATLFPPNDPPSGVVDQRPEGLFIWDGEDGLENGEYELYIGTYIPHMRERVIDAATASKGLVSGVPAMTEPNLLYQSAANVPIGGLSADRVTYEVLRLDPTSPDASNTRFNSVFALDVITDPTEARGVAPRVGAVNDPSVKPGGLIHPDDWNPPVEYRAGSDGYIFYGNNAAGGWRPQTVRVTDNFLAVRVRNVGKQGDVGIITHIVLTPRKRTAGRVNVNTVQSRIATYDPSGPSVVGHQYFNTLLGIPGIVDVATSVEPSNGVVTAPLPPGADVDLLSFDYLLPITSPSAWAPPVDLFGLASPVPTRNKHDNDPPATDSDILVPNGITSITDRHMAGSYRLSSMIMGGRTEHPDGRYYESVGDLTESSNGFDFIYGADRADRPSLTPSGDPWDLAGVDADAVYPLSNESLRWKRFDEVQARLKRMGNIITTRSDVFEIIMTVEAGYGVDKNNDGFINYRDKDEFVTTAATKASATYERRSPSDQSDGQE